ncbi:unnamed protein product [Symbiodinium necroappetens]|uniref:Uncharacterized protein n=1 Tax=Symbiodinium necroappetens TaxID=1628268 RepID=A0A812TA82_9DINO|nr:unnamed protein product [Symbiodinium necroappetens]
MQCQLCLDVKKANRAQRLYEQQMSHVLEVLQDMEEKLILRGLAREKAFLDLRRAGVDYNIALLDAWNFRVTHGRHLFAPEVFRYVDDVVIVRPAPRDHDHDTEVASAADFLVHHGYVFDWESQLDEAQQMTRNLGFRFWLKEKVSQTRSAATERAGGAAESEGAFKCNASQAVGNPLKAGTSAEECCQDICELHKCSPLWVPNPEARTLPGNTDEKCCLPTCGQVRCDPGYIYDEPMIEKPGTTKEECCVKSCELFKCDAAHGFSIPEKKKSQKATSADDCCEPQCRHHDSGLQESEKGWLKDVSKDDQTRRMKNAAYSSARHSSVRKDGSLMRKNRRSLLQGDLRQADMFAAQDCCGNPVKSSQRAKSPRVYICLAPRGLKGFPFMVREDDSHSSYGAYFSIENGKVRCVFDKDFGDHGLCRLATGEKEQRGRCLRDGLRKLAVYETSWLRNMQYDLEGAAKDAEDFDAVKELQDFIESAVKEVGAGPSASALVALPFFQLGKAREPRKVTPELQQLAQVQQHIRQLMDEMSPVISSMLEGPEGEQAESLSRRVTEWRPRAAFCQVLRTAVMRDDPQGTELDGAAGKNLSPRAFEALAVCFKAALDSSDEQSDAWCGRDLMVLAQLFRTDDEDGKQVSLLSRVYNHALWNKVTFWEEVLLLSLCEAYAAEAVWRRSVPAGSQFSKPALLELPRRFVGYMMAFGISFEQGRSSVTSTLRKSHAFLGQQTVQLYGQLLLSAYEVATPQGTATGPGELNLAVLEAPPCAAPKSTEAWSSPEDDFEAVALGVQADFTSEGRQMGEMTPSSAPEDHASDEDADTGAESEALRVLAEAQPKVLPTLDFEGLAASEQSGLLLQEVQAAMAQFASRSLHIELGGAEEGVEVTMTIKNASSGEAKALKAEILRAEENFLGEVEQRLAAAKIGPSSGGPGRRGILCSLGLASIQSKPV